MNSHRITRDHRLILLAFARDSTAAPWRPAALAVEHHAGPRYVLRTSPLPEDLDAALALLAFLDTHRDLIRDGVWGSLLRREATVLVAAGSPKGLTQLAVYAEPFSASVDDLARWHLDEGHIEPFGTVPSPELDTWGSGPLNL